MKLARSLSLATLLLLTCCSGIEAQTTAEEINSTIEDMHNAGTFDGVVLIVENGQTVASAAYGLAHRGHNVANTLDTTFNTASMYKMFTAVAIMKLYEEGKVGLDDTVDTWLDEEWLPAEVAGKIKVRHLLSHTSGLGSYWGEKYEKSSKLAFMELDAYKPLVDGVLAFEPGTDWQYSNTGFLLLGVIIEKVTGMSYFDYTEKHVFTPAGMTRTACYKLDRPVENMATGYYEEDGQILNNTYSHVARGGPAGGGYTTAADMIRFAEALWNNTLLSAETYKLMTSASNGNPEGGYGFGFGDMVYATGHTGGFPGISDIFMMSKEPGKAVIVMANFGSTRPLGPLLHSYISGNPVEERSGPRR